MAQETSSSDHKILEAATAVLELTRTGSSGRLNPKAPDFVPRTSFNHVVGPIHHHHHPIHVFSHPTSPGTAYYAPAATATQFDYYTGFVDHDVVTSPVDPDPNLSQPVPGKDA